MRPDLPIACCRYVAWDLAPGLQDHPGATHRLPERLLTFRKALSDTLCAMLGCVRKVSPYLLQVAVGYALRRAGLRQEGFSLPSANRCQRRSAPSLAASSRFPRTFCELLSDTLCAKLGCVKNVSPYLVQVAVRDAGRFLLTCWYASTFHIMGRH